MSKFPFKELREGKVLRRTFTHDVDSEELIWHRDSHDRSVKVVEGKGWCLQLDDKLPTRLTPGDICFIPAGVWHRVLKKTGCSDLVVEITE